MIWISNRFNILREEEEKDKVRTEEEKGRDIIEEDNYSKYWSNRILVINNKKLIMNSEYSRIKKRRIVLSEKVI